jgi:TetR/AcrR family transcriptional regulator
MPGRPSRKQQILEALARELESNPGGRITTAALAAAAGVSEAALYRHFASKARMFEALIDFAEEAVFARINQIFVEEKRSSVRCGHLIYLLLGFAERNPGITRILMGEVLLGENQRLRDRVDRFFGRFETQLKQVLREAKLRQGGETPIGAEESAALLLALAEGRLHRFLRSGFDYPATRDWERQWEMLSRSLFLPEAA